MRDAVELVKLIKQVAVDAVNAAKPVEVVFGKVKSVSPLQITVDQKMTLGKNQLILTERTAKCELTAGDQLILIRQQGGQKYIVLDRIG